MSATPDSSEPGGGASEGATPDEAYAAVHAFSAVIEPAGAGGAYVAIPFDVLQAFGRGHVPVLAHFDGHPYRGSVVRRGPVHMLIVRKDVQAATGKSVGDQVSVRLREDTQPRDVEVPADLRAALAAVPGALDRFGALSYTRRRECVQSIEAARRQDTRARRVRQAVLDLSGPTATTGQ